MNGLVIRTPWVDKILAGDKIWEIRGTKTKVRGPVALIRGGSGLIVGRCELHDVVGPLTLQQLQDNGDKVGFTASKLPYEKTYAWVLRNAVKFVPPRPYKHPSGAVIWVKLDGVS
jgi:hypothetical protein